MGARRSYPTTLPQRHLHAWSFLAITFQFNLLVPEPEFQTFITTLRVNQIFKKIKNKKSDIQNTSFKVQFSYSFGRS